jgi:CHAT domain-containing protein
MRQQNPRLAKVDSVQALSLADIQKHLLHDADTLLLVYSLGEERSVLWTITKTSFASHPLPERERIERAAVLVRDVLSHRLHEGSSLRQKALEDLAAIVLEPAVADLVHFKRLLIVADGALQTIPFGALLVPGAAQIEGRSQLLIERHPIIYLPSASVGATLRNEKPPEPFTRSPLIAVVADPVFEASDPRVQRTGGSLPPEKEIIRGPLVRSVRDLGLDHLDRLPFSRQEVEAIQALWRPGEVLQALDFAASRDVLSDQRWQQAAILHFATHSLLDDRQPELSGLVFSLVGPDGTPRTDGFLRLHDVYALDLKADMVVLSACQTATGKELRGEGLLGLTRGFMSIGVPQVVSSLWKVDDRATAELMTRLYRNLFDGKRPPEALQEAQKSMASDPHWGNPVLWAGFIFLGDPERMPGGGIEVRDAGGSDAARRADTGGLPPPKAKPPRPKEKAPQAPDGGHNG